jgi:hypothetical protein
MNLRCRERATQTGGMRLRWRSSATKPDQAGVAAVEERALLHSCVHRVRVRAHGRTPAPIRRLQNEALGRTLPVTGPESVNMAHITLSRTSFVGWLLLQGGPFLSLACVPHVGSAAPGSDHAADAAQEPAAEKRKLAIVRALAFLRTAGVDPSLLTVTSAEPVTWPDSSLGCPQPGIQYLQMLTPGYRIELHGAQGDYLVHVAGNRSIVCTGKAGAPSRLTRPLVPVRDIDLMTQRAREMLAAAMHAPAEQIRVVGFQPQVWPDTGLGCPATAQSSVPGRVSGFRIVLEHGGREYTFNTDLHRVIACPAIDAE